jgi:aspartyl-tRNA(Asn)/glutamyl-tRNA(Gln) amidotransferase subunit A
VKGELKTMAGFVPQSITKIQADYDHGLSPVRLIEDCLQRIDRGNADCNAMIYVAREEALAGARLAEGELRAGRRRGTLHGIPIAIKDVIDVRGWPTTSGSRLFCNSVAGADASCVRNLRAAGAIIIGKTNLHELTGGDHDNPWYGKVVNPLDSTRGTGGTSSGSAAAVAAGFCVAAIGTDTGGSNRSTAAATGLVGLKPTNGIIDPGGVRATAPSFDTIGPIANSVEDARLVHFAMRGAVPPKPRAIETAGLRVGLCPDIYFATTDPEVTRAHDRWLRSLADAGATTVTLPFNRAENVREAGRIILMYEFAQQYGSLVERHPDCVGRAVLDFLSTASSIGEKPYMSAVASRSDMRSEFLSLLSSVDLLATPPVPGLAPRLSDEMTKVGEDFVPYGLAGGNFRRWANFFGVPTLAMPLPIEGGLPASIQISMLPNEEEALFSTCTALCQVGV